MSITPARVLGLGTSLPERVLTNADLEKMVDTSDEWIVTRTGIRERRIIAEGQQTSDLSAEAARRAMAEAGLPPDAIELIIVTTVTADTVFPAAACLVQHKIGAKHAAAYDLVNGCTGWVYGLVQASALIGVGAYEHCLVIGAEALSRITDWEDRTTCVLFGDGAGAVVLGPGEPGDGLLSFHFTNQGEYAHLLAMPAGGTAQRVTQEARQRKDDCIQMLGKELFRLAVSGLPAVAEIALQKAGLTPDDIDAVVMHQANIRIIQAAAKRLGVADEKVIITIDQHGNTSAASMPLAIDVARSQGKIKRGDTLLLLGFGAGFSLGAAVWRW